MANSPHQEQFAFLFVDNYNVPDSMFAQNGFDKLPTPDQVRLCSLKHEARHVSGTGLSKSFLRPSVLFYRELGLAVKFGHHVSISEAHCLLLSASTAQRCQCLRSTRGGATVGRLLSTWSSSTETMRISAARTWKNLGRW